MTERLPGSSALVRSAFVHLCVRAALMVAGSALVLPPAEAGLAEDVSPVSVVGGDLDSDEGDHILLVSTRVMGTRCDARAMATGLRCERRDADGRWRRLSWDATLADFDEPMPTVIYVHGNRVSSEADEAHGLALYRWLAARRRDAGPMRYVIWSWPATKIRGQIKDYEVKAARTRPCGWQLAWAIDQLPPQAPLTIVGYSYGARVTTGALHLLGGGRLGDLELTNRAHPDRPPVNVALVAAAVHAQWLRPEGYHGRALSQAARLVLVNNTQDPAMRFYPISPVGRHSAALGYAGVPGRGSLGELGTRIHNVDLTTAVGRHHALQSYLASAALGRALGQVVELPAVAPDVAMREMETSEASELADLEGAEAR